MLKRDYEGQNCSIARALEVVGERWTLLIIRDVFLGRRPVVAALVPKGTRVLGWGDVETVAGPGARRDEPSRFAPNA